MNTTEESGRMESWEGWRDSFRALWPPDIGAKGALDRIALLFRFKNERKFETIYERGNRKAVREIAAQLGKLEARFAELNEQEKWKLPENKIREFNRDLLPRLARLCGLEEPAPEYRLLKIRYDDLRVWEGKWRTVSRVAMVAINQGMFRLRRLQWQQRKPDSYTDPTQVGSEDDEQMEARLINELVGREPWGPGLRKLTVIIAADDLVDRYREASGNIDTETAIATRKFWSRYREKLLRNAAREKKEGKRKNGERLIVEIYESSHIDFIGHYFDYHRAAGYITGTSLVGCYDAPLAFEVDWPASYGPDAPPHFSHFVDALDEIRRHAKPLFPPPKSKPA